MKLWFWTRTNQIVDLNAYTSFHSDGAGNVFAEATKYEMLTLLGEFETEQEAEEYLKHIYEILIDGH